VLTIKAPTKKSKCHQMKIIGLFKDKAALQEIKESLN